MTEPSWDNMAYYLYIVSAEHWALVDDLLERFSGDPKAQVILDRRHGNRRQIEAGVALERRRADRHKQLGVSEELRRRLRRRRDHPRLRRSRYLPGDGAPETALFSFQRDHSFWRHTSRVTRKTSSANCLRLSDTSAWQTA